ncbi:hypothetical protein BGZ46_002387 [Entomortierella lignicola]|nr:hypothetical protein BGZ46_002387 [Entomortierella lignicola]
MAVIPTTIPNIITKTSTLAPPKTTVSTIHIPTTTISRTIPPSTTIPPTTTLIKTSTVVHVTTSSTSQAVSTSSNTIVPSITNYSVSSTGDGMNGGTIAGLVVGVIVVLVGSVVGGFFLLKQRRKRLMMLGRSARSYNGYPEPDLERPMAAFRREGAGSRPASGYNSSGYGVLPSGASGMRRLDVESGIYDEKSYHAASAGLGGARMTRGDFGSNYSTAGESYAQLSNGMFVATGRREGDTSPTSPTNRSGIETDKKLRANSTQSIDLDPEQLERLREIDLQQQARLLSMASGEISPSTSSSSASPTIAGPYAYSQPLPKFDQSLGDAQFQRPNSYHPQSYDSRGGYQNAYFPPGGQRPYSMAYQQSYPQFSGPYPMRPMMQYQHGAQFSPSPHSPFGSPTDDKQEFDPSNEKQELDQALSTTTAVMSNGSRLSGSESHSSYNTAIATPLLATAPNVDSKVDQEPQRPGDGSEGVVLLDTVTNAAEKEEYQENSQDDHSVATALPPLSNSTKPNQNQ